MSVLPSPTAPPPPGDPTLYRWDYGVRSVLKTIVSLALFFVWGCFVIFLGTFLVYSSKPDGAGTAVMCIPAMFVTVLVAQRLARFRRRM